MGGVRRKLRHVEAREDVGVMIHNILLVITVGGNVLPVGLLGGVHEKFSDFGRVVKSTIFTSELMPFWRL
jgi:hypothetical protein